MIVDVKKTLNNSEKNYVSVVLSFDFLRQINEIF